MQFDVIIGNPPYQLSDGSGGGTGAMPIYQRFIAQAQRLEPRFLTMVVPSKWFSGGRGLDEFRASMLADRRLRRLVDFPDSREAFSGVDVAGGVCYFLWDRDNPGTCMVETISGGARTSTERVLDEYDVFVRDNRVLSVIKSVEASGDESLSGAVSARRPFGIDSTHERDSEGELYLYASGKDGRIRRADVPKGADLVDRWKVLLSKTSSEHAGQTDKSGRRRVLSRIEVMPPGTVATESYLILGPFDTEAEAASAAAYLRTRFARFLVAAVLLTQNITRGSFAFVPAQDFTRTWTDEQLYAKYGLTGEQIAFIESVVRPMELADAED
jgi:site-specific DNA-methyltransferase (adenine-specific)